MNTIPPFALTTHSRRRCCPRSAAEDVSVTSQQSRGAFDVSARLRLPPEGLEETTFECVLALPVAGFQLREELTYVPGE